MEEQHERAVYKILRHVLCPKTPVDPQQLRQNLDFLQKCMFCLEENRALLTNSKTLFNYTAKNNNIDNNIKLNQCWICHTITLNLQ